NRIVAGQTVSGTTSQGDLDAYEYTSGGSEIGRASSRQSSYGLGALNPVFDLVAPDGSVLKTNQTFLQSFRLTNAGVYQIVSREGGADDIATYDLPLMHVPGLNISDDRDTNRIVAGQTVSGTTSQGDLDAYEYTSGGS